MTRNTGPTVATVQLVWERDRGACARCGLNVRKEDRGTSWSLHHRRPRGMGGTRHIWVNLPANLAVLCGSGTTGCHGWVEGNRSTAVDAGWLVSGLGRTLPADIPYLHAIHGYGHALDNGLFERITP